LIEEEYNMKTLMIVLAGSWLMSACMDQYNPLPYWKQFTTERQITSAKRATLTDSGEFPAKEVAVSEVDPVSAKFASLCSSCHGAEGDGNSPAAASMNPKPRNFHDKSWQAKVDDAHIVKAIKEGGTSVGLSGTMPPWGAVLSKEDVDGLVAKIRAWGK
jgi:mono/diheme cytochrome c family protein